ncbi:MAG: response regulator [Desulfobacteraceae bacterium]
MDSEALGTILVVDDDMLSVEMCRHLLEAEGYVVHTATNGREALERVQEVWPDLILLDIVMPEMGGYKACLLLKKQDATMDIPVIFMSGLTETFDKVKAFEAGGIDFISKPVEPLELMARVRNQISLGRLQQELKEVNADLEKRVAARSQELSVVNEALVAEIEERKQTERALTYSREQLRALYVQLANIEEGERRRLARELHDQVGQNLTALGINLNVVLNQLSDMSRGKVEARLHDSLRIASETAVSIRDVMAALRPQVLDDYGLKAALQMEAERFAVRTGISTDVVGKEANPRASDGVETALFRIAQEALTNVSKHGRAKRAVVRMEQADGRMRLTIEDDGVGFDPEKVNPGRHSGWGLVNMRERIQAHDGSLKVISSPGAGTRIEVEVTL